MKALILAGGKGTRLRPVTYEIPKPLITVKKKPIVNHLVELFIKHGIAEVGMLVAREHASDFAQWERVWGASLPQVKVIMFYEDTPRGTFGGLEYARAWLGNEQFILSNGDELKDFNLTDLVTFHNRRKPIATIALVEVSNPHEYGVPVMTGDSIKEFLEKPNPAPSRFISSGLYVLEPEVFDHADFSKSVLMIEKDIFPKLAKAGKLLGRKMEGGRWYDCGNLERWERAMREW